MNRTSSRRRRYIRWLCLLLGLYFAVVVVAMLSENALIFVGAGRYWKNPPSERFEEVSIPSPEGTMLCWWLPPPHADSLAVIFFNGNGGNVSTSGNWAEQMQKQLNCGVLLVDYPGYGKSEGKPSEAGCYVNATYGLEWLIQKQSIPPERIVAMGLSLGGGVAIEMATKYPVRAVVLVSTYTSLPAAAKHRFPFLPTSWLMRNRFDSLSKIDRVTAPVFIAHGTIDGTIPFEQGEALFAAANEPKQFLQMDGKGHNDCLNGELLNAVKVFLQRIP